MNNDNEKFLNEGWTDFSTDVNAERFLVNEPISKALVSPEELTELREVAEEGSMGNLSDLNSIVLDLLDTIDLLKLEVLELKNNTSKTIPCPPPASATLSAREAEALLPMVDDRTL